MSRAPTQRLWESFQPLSISSNNVYFNFEVDKFSHDDTNAVVRSVLFYNISSDQIHQFIKLAVKVIDQIISECSGFMKLTFITILGDGSLMGGNFFKIE